MIFLLALLFSFPYLKAAPIPGTATSLLTSSNAEMLRSSHGFQLHAADTSWVMQTSKTQSQNLEAIYKSPKLTQGLQASLTVRVDQRKSNVSFKQYLKRTLKDYTRLGLEVMRAKPVKINNITGFLVDAVGQNRQKQIRQIVFGKGKTMVILTCRDNEFNFRVSVKDCNEIFKSFQWL